MKTIAQGTWLVLLLLLLTALALPRAAAGLSTDFALQIAAGLREDRLDWSISGFVPHENTGEIFPARSELLWKDLRIWQMRTGGMLSLASEEFTFFTTQIRGTAGYGWIDSGRNQDSDFVLVDSEFIEFSRSNNRADRGNVLDLSLGIGARFEPKAKVAITPLLGYSYHEQNLKITDGFQTIPAEGPFPGLDSRYETEWRGPWLGLEVTYQPVERLSLTGKMQYHWADFQAAADWNLRTDFQHPVSFTHDANATGIDFSTVVAYQLAPRWSLELIYDYRKWETDAGIHRFFFVDGVAAVPLNEVNWKAQALSLGLSHRF